MKNYELLYIVPNQFTDEEVKEIQNEINGLIAKYGGQIGYQEFLGRKRLAYPIKKAANGYYLAAEFEMEDGAGIKVLNNDLRLHKKILRAQIITKAKITPEEIARKERGAAKAGPELKPATRSEEKPAKKEEKKISREQLDEKLEEILKDDMI